MTNEDPIMNDEQVEEAVAKYLEDNPELLQGIVPEHDLWPAIESRISARVIPMSVKPAHAGRRAWGWLPMLAAASALVVASAGITYLLTTSAASRSGASGAVASTSPTGVSVTHNPLVDTVTRPATQVASVEPTRSKAARDGATTHAKGNAPDFAQRTSSATQLASHHTHDEGDQVRKTYDSEITTLHAALEARRGQLNPATVAVIEQNLRVIDEAISQSEAALARDPNSRLLNDQLDRTLAKKTGLLRAAALLPAA